MCSLHILDWNPIQSSWIWSTYTHIVSYSKFAPFLQRYAIYSACMYGIDSNRSIINCFRWLNFESNTRRSLNTWSKKRRFFESKKKQHILVTTGKNRKGWSFIFLHVQKFSFSSFFPRLWYEIFFSCELSNGHCIFI